MERGGGHDGEELPDVQPVLLLLRAEGEEAGDQAVRLSTHIYSYLLISTFIYSYGRFSAVKRQLSWPLLDSVADTSLALRPAADKVSLIDIYLSKYLTI